MLNTKQSVFVNEYIKDFNATQAALRAGYSKKTAYSQGQRLLKHAEIRAAIDQVLEERAMSANEVAERLGRIARFDAGKYIDKNGYVNLQAIKDDGFGYCIKKIRHTKDGMQVEFHNNHQALVDIGKIHAMFSDRVEQSGDINVNITYD